MELEVGIAVFVVPLLLRETFTLTLTPPGISAISKPSFTPLSEIAI